MFHDDDTLDKISGRRKAFISEILASRSDPDRFSMFAVSLCPGGRPNSAKAFGIVNRPDVIKHTNDAFVVLFAAKICRPNIIKSEIDDLIQDRRDRAVDDGLEKLRVVMNVNEMRKAGHSRASSVPGIGFSP